MGTLPSCGNWLKSVILCIILGCLAPERPGYGSARAALSMDLDEICKLAHTPFRLPLVDDCNFFATCNNPFVICVPMKDDNYGAKEMQSLRSLVLNLRQLLDLHQKYNCRLSLSVFEKVFVTHIKHAPLSIIWVSYYLFINYLWEII